MSEAGLGAHFELGPVSLAAMAGLTSATQQLAKAQSDWIEQEKEYQRLGPVFVQMLASGTVDSGSDPLIMDLGGPAAGRVYEVRQLIVGGLLWSTTVAGNARSWCNQTRPLPILRPASGPCRTWLQLAERGFLLLGQFRVMHPNHIFVVVVGARPRPRTRPRVTRSTYRTCPSKRIFDI